MTWIANPIVASVRTAFMRHRRIADTANTEFRTENGTKYGHLKIKRKQKLKKMFALTATKINCRIMANCAVKPVNRSRFIMMAN